MSQYNIGDADRIAAAQDAHAAAGIRRTQGGDKLLAAQERRRRAYWGGAVPGRYCRGDLSVNVPRPIPGELDELKACGWQLCGVACNCHD